MGAGNNSMADYTDTIDLATRIHAGYADKAGKLYIEHVSRVVEAVRAAGGSEAQVVAAYLHDAIEDTSEIAQSQPNRLRNPPHRSTRNGIITTITLSRKPGQAPYSL